MCSRRCPAREQAKRRADRRADPADRGDRPRHGEAHGRLRWRSEVRGHPRHERHVRHEHADAGAQDRLDVLRLRQGRVVRVDRAPRPVDGERLRAEGGRDDPAELAGLQCEVRRRCTRRRRRWCTSATRPATLARIRTTARSCTAPASTTRRTTRRTSTIRGPVTYGVAVRYNPWTGFTVGFGYSTPFMHVGIVVGGPRYGGWYGPYGRPPYPPPYYRPPYDGYPGYRPPPPGYRPPPPGYRPPARRISRLRQQHVSPAGQHGPRRTAEPHARCRPESPPPGRPNNVVAGKDGNVYRQNGSQWQQNSGGKWQNSSAPTTGSRPSTQPTGGSRPSTQLADHVRPHSPPPSRRADGCESDTAEPQSRAAKTQSYDKARSGGSAPKSAPVGAKSPPRTAAAADDVRNRCESGSAIPRSRSHIGHRWQRHRPVATFRACYFAGNSPC